MKAFVFSGQGAQRPGMAQELVAASSAARAVFTEISDAIGLDLAALCFGDEASQERLNQTENTQPAMLAADLAAWAALRQNGVEAELCAGFSLGEYAALVCAGVLSAGDAGRLIQKRAAYMSACRQGAMAAVLGLPAAELETICVQAKAGYVAAVNYNAPGQITIAGEVAAVQEVVALLKARKIRAVPLKVSGGFHSELMRPAAEKLGAILETVTFINPRIPIICNVTAQPFDPQSEDWRAMLRAQVCSPVLWEQSVRTMVGMGAACFFECGPGKVLTGLNKRICPAIKTCSVEDAATLDEAKKWSMNKKQ